MECPTLSACDIIIAMQSVASENGETEIDRVFLLS